MPLIAFPFRRLVAVVATVGLLIVAAFALRPVSPTETIADAEYHSLRTVTPVRAGEEAYTTVPWETSLTAAQHKARTERKPMLVWSMDGHPLGCG
jgi:hypothetical protein